MTDPTRAAELTAAVVRVTRANSGEALSEIYGRDHTDDMHEYLLASDKDTLASAYLATVAADEGAVEVAPGGPKQITIATDIRSDHQAIYVNGELTDEDNSLYATELSGYIGPDEPVLFKCIEVELESEWAFPYSLDELRPLGDEDTPNG